VSLWLRCYSPARGSRPCDAITRHAIDLDLAHLDPMQLVGLAALLVALSLGYYFFKRAAAIASPAADRTPLGG